MLNPDKSVKSLSALAVSAVLSFQAHIRGAGAGPAGTTAAVPMLEAKHMNLIKGRLQKF